MLGYKYLGLIEARIRRNDKCIKQIYARENNFVASRYLNWILLLTLIRKIQQRKPH